MLRLIHCGLVSTALLALATAANAADRTPVELSAQDKAKLQALIQKLGDSSFKAREAAANQIVQYGRAAAPLLREGMNHSIAEVRSRCARLLPIAMQHDLEKLIKEFLDHKDGTTQLACWDRFKELAGNDETARQLFVDLHRVDNEFLDLIDRDPQTASDRMSGRCQEFMQSRNFGQDVGNTTQVAIMLFAVLHPKLKIDGNAQSHFSTGLYTMSFAQRSRDVIGDNPAVRKLLAEYIRKSSKIMSHQYIQMVANLELKEAIDVVKRFVKSSPQDTYVCPMAIATLGRIGSRSEIPDVLPFLENSTSAGSVQFGNGSAINTQMRDVALATLVILSGQNLNDYGFAYLKAFNNNMGRMNFNFALSPGMLGFSDDATRTASLKKWRDWYEAENKKK